MRAGARVDDRVAVDGLEPRVVPAAAQVVALLVVGGRAEPGRLASSPSSSCLEDDEALLQVRLVVVGAVERRAPVVHRVEEHVVEDDPAALADDPAVVDDPRVASPDRVVAHRGRGGRAARDAAAQQQRGDQPGVDEPGGEADPGQPARGGEPLVLGPVPPAPSSSAFSGSGTKRRNWASPGGGSPTAASRSRSSSPAGMTTRPRAGSARSSRSHASTYDPVGHREEQLAVGEPEDRLVAAEELEVGRRRLTARRLGPWLAEATIADVALVEVEDRDRVDEHREVARLAAQPPAEVEREDQPGDDDREDPAPSASWSEQADDDQDARDEQTDDQDRGAMTSDVRAGVELRAAASRCAASRRPRCRRSARSGRDERRRAQRRERRRRRRSRADSATSASAATGRSSRHRLAGGRRARIASGARQRRRAPGP